MLDFSLLIFFFFLSKCLVSHFGQWRLPNALNLNIDINLCFVGKNDLSKQQLTMQSLLDIWCGRCDIQCLWFTIREQDVAGRAAGPGGAIPVFHLAPPEIHLLFSRWGRAKPGGPRYDCVIPRAFQSLGVASLITRSL